MRSSMRFSPRLPKSWTIVAVVLLLAAGCSRRQELPAVRIGVQRSAQTATVWLALERGLYRREGVRVRLQPYPSGKRALQGMLRHQVELAVAAETPLAITLPFQPGLRLYGSLSSSDDNICVLARRDHGILRAADLRGKRIATQRGSAVHFFLSSFLLDAGLEPQDVKLRFLPVEALADAFGKGTVDAISMRDPVLARAASLAGPGNSIRFCRPGLYTKTYSLVGWKDFDKRHPGAMEAILRALIRASALIRNDPDEAAGALQKELGTAAPRLREMWQKGRFVVSLGQALLVSLQEELRWAAANGLVDPSVLAPGRYPDFLERIDTAPLRRVAPGAVGLIGLEGSP